MDDLKQYCSHLVSEIGVYDTDRPYTELRQWYKNGVQLRRSINGDVSQGSAKFLDELDEGEFEIVSKDGEVLGRGPAHELILLSRPIAPGEEFTTRIRLPHP